MPGSGVPRPLLFAPSDMRCEFRDTRVDTKGKHTFDLANEFADVLIRRSSVTQHNLQAELGCRRENLHGFSKNAIMSGVRQHGIGSVSVLEVTFHTLIAPAGELETCGSGLSICLTLHCWRTWS